MKPSIRQFLIPLAFVAAVLIHPVFALALLFGSGAALGTSYNIMNPQTATGIVALAANDREKAWAKKIILGAYNKNVFAEYCIGTPGSKKAFIDYTDTRRIKGNTIILTNVPQLGGEGAQGETQRNGLEEQIGGSDQTLQVGRQWYGMGVTTVAQAETIIGSEWDNLNSPLLEQRVGLKKSNDMQMVLRESATSDNRISPNGKTLATLKTADTFQTSVITKGGVTLSGNGAEPTVLTSDAKRGVVEGYTFMGALDSFTSLYQDPTYQAVISRNGKDNAIQTGKFSDWNGHLVYPLQLRSRGGKGSVGSPLLRRAFLGVAIAANDATVNAGIITGGGIGTAAGFKYFEHFSGYAYKLTNGAAPTYVADGSTPAQAGSTLTGDGTGPWYVAMIDKTTGKYALFSYTANTGTTLTGVKRAGSTASSNVVTALTGASTLVGNVSSAYNASSNAFTTATGGGAQGLADETVAVAQGSLIVEINKLGVPFADTFGLGEQAGVCGYGMIPGAGFPGKRTKQVGNHELDVAVGFEFSFGCRAWLNIDMVPTNYVRITHSIQVDGMPAVA